MEKNLIEILKPLFEGEIEFDVFLHENLTYISSIQTLETIEEYEALLGIDLVGQLVTIEIS